MELKDVILSTIAELGEEPDRAEAGNDSGMDMESAGGGTERDLQKVEAAGEDSKGAEAASDSAPTEDETQFLENLRERLLVLFEGFQSPNNKRVEAKVDLTINFLEYLLALLDERIDALKKQ